LSLVSFSGLEDLSITVRLSLGFYTGSEAAAHRTAILCSLVQTCKHRQINPFVYLRDVIERVSTHPARLVQELTPREWKRLRRDSGAQAAA
jgi:hypothetical protein